MLGLKKIYLLCVAVLLIFGEKASSIPLANFYSFGPVAGDSSLPSNDDGSSGRITLDFSFPFFGTGNRQIFVNNNGVISFNAAVSQFTSAAFPLGDGRMLIAPYWADVDTRGTGTVWYRQTVDQTLLSRARNEIRRSFLSQMSFQPTMLFIATWERVGYYNRRMSPTNTFQCVLVTDGTRSFTIFNYADGMIQWTTGDASGGRGGLGGTPAQVGFNAGDGIRFASVPGSRTAEILNIDTTTNVGTPGVWIYRVDSEEITVADVCTPGPDAPLNIGPRAGSLLGGTAIYVSGPCFNPAFPIGCYFGDDQAENELDTRMETGTAVSELLALCVSPSFQEAGWKYLTVRVPAPVDDFDFSESFFYFTSRFYALPPEDTDDVRVDEDSSLLLDPASPDALTVMWEPSSILLNVDPSMYTVNVELYRVEMSPELGPEYRQIATLLTNAPNNGRASVSVPRSGTLRSDVHPVSVRISVAGRSDSETPDMMTSLIDGASGAVAKWTLTLYYSASRGLEFLCSRWCANQEEGIGETIQQRLPPCPPRVDQARAQNSGFREDTGYWTLRTNSFFHPDAHTCFRQRNILSSHQGSGQQCCYRRNGDLLLGSESAGSADLVAPDGFINTVRHFFVDVLPAIYCCKGRRSSATCQMYFDKRPADDGSRYNPPAPACVYGDPHIVTLDGFKYTFNGLGEFVLIETSDNAFTLQGRMVQALNDVDNLISATVFSAIVGKEMYSDTVQFQLANDSSSVEVLMNGELIDFENLTEQIFNNVTVRQENNSSAIAVFASGVYIEVRAANGILSTLLVSLADDYISQTTGLMGNFDDDTSNDLLPQGSDAPIALTSSLQDIHNMFGVTWIISNSSESLFTYEDGESWSTFYRPNFQPVFQPTFSSPELQQQADEICGDDQFCRFDIAATNRVDIGLTTLQGNIEFETISNISELVTCDPPCDFGVCVRTDTCSCADGYQGDTCSDIIIGPCEENPCDNGGDCTLLATTAVCSCPADFTGLFCEERIGGPGLGSGDIEDCTLSCIRDIECSFSGRLDGAQILSTSSELKCTIIAEENAGVQRDNIVIDDTFTTQYLSPGSLTFLASVGALSRDMGFESCEVYGNLSSFPLLEVLGVDSINVVYFNEDNSIRSLDLTIDNFQEAIFGGDITAGQLDEVNQCSLVFLFNWLSQPQPEVEATCRVPDSETDPSLAYFPVNCIQEFF